MKATGIVRRIDDLGRVVIPKEIRRTMRIREGDPLEIYTDKDGEVIFKKYSPMNELSDFAAQICDSLNKSSGMSAAISDRDTIIAVCGAPKRELVEKTISPDLEQIMEARHIYSRRQGERSFALSEQSDKYTVAVASPIIAEGDVMGCVIFFSDDNSAGSDIEVKLAQTVSSFLGKQMEA